MLDATLPIISDLVREAAHPLTGSQTDYDDLLEFIGDARLVLLGEASHGTHEFYRERARITKRLILEKGFTGIAVEATGRMPTGLIATYKAKTMMRMPSRP
jgi:erythromycin esterase-like protein